MTVFTHHCVNSTTWKHVLSLQFWHYLQWIYQLFHKLCLPLWHFFMVKFVPAFGGLRGFHFFVKLAEMLAEVTAKMYVASWNLLVWKPTSYAWFWFWLMNSQAWTNCAFWLSAGFVGGKILNTQLLCCGWVCVVCKFLKFWVQNALLVGYMQQLKLECG